MMTNLKEASSDTWISLNIREKDSDIEHSTASYRYKSSPKPITKVASPYSDGERTFAISGSADITGPMSNVRIDRSIALLHGKGEYEEFQKEHQRYARRKLETGLSSREQKEYEMVLWHLDRIEDAQIGESLDVLDSIAQRHQQLESQVCALVSSWGAATNNGGRRRFQGST